MSVNLNCLVFGDKPNQFGNFTIGKRHNVDNLKAAIRDRKGATLKDVDLSTFNLWKVSIPIAELATKLQDIHLDDSEALYPNQILGTTFVDPKENHLHVVAKASEFPGKINSSHTLTLNCYVLDDPPDKVFTVEIAKDKNLGILKDRIKKQMPLRIGPLDDTQIDLWGVSIPIGDLQTQNPMISGPKLRLDKPLSELFPGRLDVADVHVVVCLPGQGPAPRSSRPPPSAYRTPFTSTDAVSQARLAFCTKRKPVPPSTGGRPQNFLEKQSLERIPCGRAPVGSEKVFPLNLVHPVFGQFIDDAKNGEPTKQDVSFFLEFVRAMAPVYSQESGRQQALLNVFEKNGIHMKASKIGSYQTDGDLSAGFYRYLIAELKNEVGSKAAEPYFQGILYFLEATRSFVVEHPNFTFPCFILLIFGPYVAFAGAAWTDRPIVQMLSPAFSCNYHETDLDMGDTLVRYLGAFRRSLRSLDKEYLAFTANPNSPRRNPTQPYPTSFVSLENVSRSFTYLSHSAPNVFFGSISDGLEAAICVKFTPRYGKEGHEFLAAKDSAPKLHAINRLPGGLYMVVMDQVGPDYITLYSLIQDNPKVLSEEYRAARESLSEKIRRRLEELHQAGFVHGDIRNTNIMVRSDIRTGSFYIIDMDWAGKIHETRYPLDLNRDSVWRPDEATGGALIEARHDMDMLDHIWELTSTNQGGSNVAS